MKPKWAVLLTVLLLLGLLATACRTTPTDTDTTTDRPLFVVAMDASFPPMEFVDENKEIVGFDVDLLTAIAEEMGFDFEIKNTAWDGIFAGLESGDYDVIMSAVTIRPDRQEKYDFTDPYINAGQAIVVQADNTEIQGPEDLSGRTAGAQIGTTGAFAIQDIEGAELKEYDSADLALLDLVSGNIDAVVVDTPVAADYALLSDQFAGRLKIVGDAITSEEYGALVNKGQNQDFLELFNEGLVRVRNSGVYDQIYARWISPDAAVAPIVTDAGSGVAPAPDFPIKVAILAPLSGDVKTFGDSTRDGVLMAFDEARAAGWEIETVITDSRCDAQEAANAANKVIFEDGVNYIIGEVCSSASIPVSEIAEAQGVLQISPTSTNPAVTINEDGSNKEFVFRACFLDPFQGEVVAALGRELGAETAAILFDVGNDYVKGLAEYFQASFEEMGGTVVAYEAYTKDDTDFSAILGKVAAADPDVIFLPDYYAKNNLIAAQIRERGIEAQLLGSDGWDSPELEIDLFEGGYFSNHYSPADPRPLVQNFVAEYAVKYGAEPDALATLAYDAAHILLQSISEAGVDDPAVVKDHMANIRFEGVSGDITFDEFGNPVKKAAIVRIVNGEREFFRFVSP